MKFPRLFWGKKEDVGVVSNPQNYYYGTYPDPTFADLVEYLRRDPTIRAAVEDLAERGVGMGFYTTAENKRAKDAIDDFCEDINLDGLSSNVARECIGFGNCFIERVFEKDPLQTNEPQIGKVLDAPSNSPFVSLKALPISSFRKVHRTKIGKIVAFEQRMGNESLLLSPRIILHFPWDIINAEAFGTGLVQTLALPGKGFTRTDKKTGEQEKIQRPAWLAIKEENENLMRDWLRRYIGRYAFVWKNVPDEKVTAWMTSISKVKENQDFGISTTGADSDASVEIFPMSIDPRAQFDPILSYVESQMIQGVQTPIIKLFTTPGFTEASAKAAVEVSERKVAAFQRYLKRIYEREIFAPFLIQRKYNPRNAKVRINWGMQEKPDVSVDHILKAAELGVIRNDEARKNLMKAGFELFEPEQQQTQPGEPRLIPTEGS